MRREATERVSGTDLFGGRRTVVRACDASGPDLRAVSRPGVVVRRAFKMLSQLPVCDGQRATKGARRTAKAMPSELTPRHETRFSWPVSTPTRSPLSVSQTLTLKSS